jgi:hypothetical protein
MNDSINNVGLWDVKFKNIPPLLLSSAIADSTGIKIFYNSLTLKLNKLLMMI